MHRLVALLERPSTKSFGMIPILVRSPGIEGLTCYGLADGPRPLGRHDEELRCFLLAQCGVVESLDINYVTPPEGRVAGWIGDAFLAGCREFDVPLPIIPDVTYRPPPASHAPEFLGRFWVAPPADIYAAMDAWLKKAAVLAFKRSSFEIAGLLNWCLPDREEAQAAWWYAVRHDARREKDIMRWFTQNVSAKRTATLLLRWKFKNIARRMLAEPTP